MAIRSRKTTLCRRRDRPLRLRMSAGVLERARTVGLRLPGQYQRAFRDYQGRVLTDAVMTAIASAEPFTDAFLDGLFPLLRQRAARNLWRLAAVDAVASLSRRAGERRQSGGVPAAAGGR